MCLGLQGILVNKSLDPSSGEKYTYDLYKGEILIGSYELNVTKSNTPCLLVQYSKNPIKSSSSYILTNHYFKINHEDIGKFILNGTMNYKAQDQINSLECTSNQFGININKITDGKEKKNVYGVTLPLDSVNGKPSITLDLLDENNENKTIYFHFKTTYLNSSTTSNGITKKDFKLESEEDLGFEGELKIFKTLTNTPSFAELAAVGTSATVSASDSSQNFFSYNIQIRLNNKKTNTSYVFSADLPSDGEFGLNITTPLSILTNDVAGVYDAWNAFIPKEILNPSNIKANLVIAQTIHQKN